MNVYAIVTVVVTFTALSGWINARFLKLPGGIGVMLLGLFVSGGLMFANLFNWLDDSHAIQLVKSLHFDKLLIGGQGKESVGEGMILGLLLFATALRIEPSAMARRFGVITWLSTMGVILTALMTALMLAGLMTLTGTPFTFTHLLLFGAILAPTDAVAVISMLKRTSAPARVREVIAGESLFNDGISIVLVLFLIAYLVPGSGDLPYANWWLGFIAETGGAIVLGIVMGLMARFLIRSIRQGSVIVLITVSAILLIGMIAPSIPVSTPVCAVVAGLVLGRSSVLSQGKGDGGLVIGFWGLVESSLTAMLFLVIGLELLTVSFEVETLMWSLAVIPILLIARYISLFIPWLVAWLLGRTRMSLDEVGLMTWCGLRGGVSIAMAIALPFTIVTKESNEPFRTSVLVATIVIVISTILFQGLTLERVARVVQRRADRRAAANAAAKAAANS